MTLQGREPYRQCACPLSRQKKRMIMFILFTGYIIPILIISICYWRLERKVRNTNRSIRRNKVHRTVYSTLSLLTVVD